MALTYKESLLVKASVPVLREHGETVSRLCYSRLLAANPEFNNILSKTNQANGRQPRAFTAVILAFASHISHTSELVPRLERMCNKHCSLGVKPEHYAVIGKHLLEAFALVLGSQWTPALNAAWAKAYSMLSKMLMTREGQMYGQFGAWQGWRNFRLDRKVIEADGIFSLHLTPCDGGLLPNFRPGQYVSVRVPVPSTGNYASRQYSLSECSGDSYYRITVRRVQGTKGEAAGVVSGLLDERQTGDILQLTHPTGEFYFDNHPSMSPLVLISAGIGVTPLISILHSALALNPDRPVSWIHCSPRKAPFEDHLRQLAEAHPNLRTKFFRSKARQPDLENKPPQYEMGRLELASIGLEKLHLDHGGAEYYICGPELLTEDVAGFLSIQGVDPARVKHELFTTGDLEFKAYNV
ncbi:globin-like protein [Stachybotrys elegans]|uniref:nitric oxide dioxygenase n=1 Tax=Stachybotrys elegans TaxID=80388 RepID=A0A8K0SP15_9HYPO|nr:globin-like protein [Stachybotrys elegans]